MADDIAYVRRGVGAPDEGGDMSAAFERHLNRPGWRLMSTRVLVVENDSFNLKLLHDLLEVLGHAVIEGRTGEDVVALARRHRPDMIFLAVGARDTSAAEMRRRLKADPGLAAIPVIALTDGVADPDGEGVIRAGFDDHLAKPISLRLFLAILENALARGSR